MPARLRPNLRYHVTRVGGPSDERAALDAAERNLEDIDACEVFVVLTTGSPARGGRHFETGYAFARDKPIIVVGPIEHTFSISPAPS